MLLLLKVLGVVLVCFVIYRISFRPAAASAEVSTARSDRGLAFLSNGVLFFRERGGQLQQLHSPYVDEALERRAQARERHSWKEGTSFNIAAGGGRRSYDAGSTPIPVTSAAFDASGNLLYFLKNDSVGGLFCREAASGKELRVVFRQNLLLNDLAPSPEGDLLAASTELAGGVCNIAIFKSDGNSYREVTGGDTVDSASAWLPGSPKWLLFQSSGLARNEEGHIVAQGPASIQRLDMEKGTVTPILEDAAYDYIKPRVSPAGNLLFIRRPYQAPRYGAGAMLTDTLFLPFRLLRAVFHYLNFFSMMYSRKPLTSANGPAVQADIKDILLQGRRIDAEKALRNARPVQGVPSLVPDTWRLVSRDQQGAERVLATNVASYDICPDGTIVYSNGRGVFVLDQDGASRLALTNDLVGDVMAASA